MKAENLTNQNKKKLMHVRNFLIIIGLIWSMLVIFLSSYNIVVQMLNNHIGNHYGNQHDAGVFFIFYNNMFKGYSNSFKILTWIYQYYKKLLYGLWILIIWLGYEGRCEVFFFISLNYFSFSSLLTDSDIFVFLNKF